MYANTFVTSSAQHLAVVPLFIWLAIILAGLLLAGAQAIKMVSLPILEPINKFIDSLTGPVGYVVAAFLLLLAIYFGNRPSKKKDL